MPIPPKRWNAVTRSPHAHEQEALDYLREGLPDHEPWRAWANFEFIAHDGSVNEVDVLVLGSTGLFIVEIKGHPGEVSGDARYLRFRGEGSFRATIDHPLYATNLKAKRLKDLLQKSRIGAKHLMPRVEALVFLSHASGISLQSPANTCVLLRDEVQQDSNGRLSAAGVLAALTKRRAPGLPSEPSISVDKVMAKKVTAALEDIGLRRVAERQRIRDYEILEVIEERELWRDMLGQHTSLSNTQLRIRCYFPGTDTLDREAVHRTARREFRALEQLRHPGILSAKDFADTEHGPVVFFEHLAGAKPLDRYLAESGSTLDLSAKLALLRRIAEAVQHAHGNRVVHRSLSPQSILVVPKEDGSPGELRVMNWTAGGRDDASGTSLVDATLHPESYIEHAAAVYLAPELRRDPTSMDPSLDVFSLGALAWLLFTGTPPADSPEELLSRCKGGLRLSALQEGTSKALDDLVSQASDASVASRFANVDKFLAALDLVTSEDVEGGFEAIPPEAGPGDKLEGGFLIKRRLGSGSTAVAFLVDRAEAEGVQSYVLKVARDPEDSPRLHREANVLRQLDHPNIACLVEEVEFGTYRGLLTQPANAQTLRQRLQIEGPLQLEFLERFGDQLLSALVHLEECGLNHRDIKPENIALADKGHKALSLVLFDFSLSGVPLDELKVGTLDYTDPFLEERRMRRWDLQAERYSAALTLHEMATGSLPAWGDGRSDPLATDESVPSLAAELFPADLREASVKFFERALARNAEARFDNATHMRGAWKSLFLGTQHAPEIEAGVDVAASLEERTRALEDKTPLSDLPLSTRARNALDRLSLFSVKDLLQARPGRLRIARGVGAKTRNELEDITRALRRLFPDVEITAEPAPKATDKAPSTKQQALLKQATVDELLSMLRPTKRANDETRRGFEALCGRGKALDIPTQVAVAKELGLTPQKFQPILTRLRRGWKPQSTIDLVRSHCANVVERLGGILTFAEAADSLLAQHGSTREGDDARAAGFALIRIACEVESREDEPRWKVRRRRDGVWLTTNDALVGYAENLGARAKKLAGAEVLPGRESVEQELAAVSRPLGVPPLTPGRLARLAVSSAGGAVDLSRRGELYPEGLDPKRALQLSIGALVGAGEPHPDDAGRRLVSIDEIRKRVNARYPRAAKLPDRPQLDELLKHAGWDATWSSESDTYLTRVDDALTMVSGSSLAPSSRQLGEVESIDSDSLTIEAFESRLQNALSNRRFFALKVKPANLRVLRHGLRETFPEVEFVDLDARLLAALEATLSERDISRSVFEEAEAEGPGGSNWGRVTTVMSLVFERIVEDLLGSEQPLCLWNIGLLARFNDWRLIDGLNPMIGGRPRRSTLLLIPGDTTQPRAVLDDAMIPHMPGQVIIPPNLWLDQFHPQSSATR